VIPQAQLGDQLAAIFKTRPAGVLFIKTGAERTYQDFITAAAIARGAGVVTVAVVGGDR
jgi:hypothetical protein